MVRITEIRQLAARKGLAVGSGFLSRLFDLQCPVTFDMFPMFMFEGPARRRDGPLPAGCFVIPALTRT